MDPSAVILLAEDNPDDALLMQRAFKSYGVARPAHVAENGATAISYLAGEGVFSDRATFPVPDLVILDLKMPGSSGFEVLQWMNDHPELRVIPTIVWSSSCDLRDVKRAYCLGANGYLVKPADFQKFKETLGRVIAFWDSCLKPVPGSTPSCEQLSQTEPFAAARPS